MLTKLDEIWKMTSIFLKLEDNLKFFQKEDDLNFLEMEDDLKKTMQPKRIKTKNNNIFENGRRPQFFWKMKTTLIFLNGRRPRKNNATKNN